jgi:undecaprenyl-diphosphatase
MRSFTRLARIELTRAEKVGIAVATLVFVLIAADVMVGGLFAHLDERIRDAVQPRRPGGPGWTALAGGLGELWVAAPLFVIVGTLTAQLTWRWWPLVFAVGTFVLVELVILVLKVVIGREGPGAQAERVGYPGYYPSGHTATSAVCAATIVFLLLCARKGPQAVERAATVALVVGLVVGATGAWRAVLGDFHWFSDGIGGLLVAYVVLIVAFAAIRTYLARSPES